MAKHFTSCRACGSALDENHRPANPAPVPDDFCDLPIGAVFNFTDGRMSEAETWMVFVKISKTQARQLVPGEFVDTDCAGYRVTREVKHAD